MPGLHIARPGVVVPVRADPTGVAGPTPGQARGRRWRTSAPGWFVPADVDSTQVEQRIVEAAVGLPDGAAVTGWAALRWLRAMWFDGLGPDGVTRLPVPVALGDVKTVTSRPEVKLSEDWLFSTDVIMIDGLPITIPERSVTYEARRARTLPRAVRFIDCAAAFDLIDLGGLGDYIARLPSRPGVVLLREAHDCADENVWSPQEPFMRCAWERDARRPCPLTNRPIFDTSGHHLFTPDLFDPKAGVAGEYDGRIHDETGPRRRDLNREELYRAQGIEVVTMLSVDRRDTADFVRRLHAAYARAAARAAARTWTLDQPDWWVDTSTVAARRALTGAERAVWLRRTRGIC